MNSFATDSAKRLMTLLDALGRRNSLRDPIAAAVEEIGLTAPQLHAVLWIGREGSLTMGEVAQRIGVTEKTITGIVDRLERAGFVRRARDEADRRVVRVRLTPTGARTHRRLDREFAAKLTTFFELLGPRDARQLFAILERLISRLASSSATPRSTRA